MHWSLGRIHLAMLFPAPLLTGCARPASEPGSGTAEEIAVASILDDFHDAAAQADFDRYFGHFSQDGVFLGTDGMERWTVADFKAYARPFFEPGGGWTYRPRNRHVSFTPAGRTAFFDEMLDNDGLGEARGSGVVVREDGRWKVAQYNLSIPIPNALAERVVALVRAPAP